MKGYSQFSSSISCPDTPLEIAGDRRHAAQCSGKQILEITGNIYGCRGDDEYVIRDLLQISVDGKAGT